MIRYALFAQFVAKPGKEQAVADFLSAGLQMANQETTTPIWFALCLASNVFGIFDAFASEEDRQACLDGPIVEALMANAAELLTSPPEIALVEVPGLRDTGAT